MLLRAARVKRPPGNDRTCRTLGHVLSYRLTILEVPQDLLRTMIRRIEHHLSGRYPIVAKHVDLALRRFRGATDGVEGMLQREFVGRTAFIEHLPGALLH